MKRECSSTSPEHNQPVRPCHEEDQAASKGDLRNAHRQMIEPSLDGTRFANILRRACGGLPRSRTAPHQSTGSKSSEE